VPTEIEREHVEPRLKKSPAIPKATGPVAPELVGENDHSSITSPPATLDKLSSELVPISGVEINLNTPVGCRIRASVVADGDTFLHFVDGHPNVSAENKGRINQEYDQAGEAACSCG
jgi:hypothetical protein